MLLARVAAFQVFKLVVLYPGTKLTHHLPAWYSWMLPEVFLLLATTVLMITAGAIPSHAIWPAVAVLAQHNSTTGVAGLCSQAQ